MMSIITFLFVFVGFVTAGQGDIINGLKILESIKLENGAVNTPNDAGEDIYSYFEQINGYGCWCFFGDESMRGNGDAQDDIDGICRQLVQGYHCISKDWLESGTICSPDMQYTAFDFKLENELVTFCDDKNNGTSCASDLCKLEGQFTLGNISYII